MMETKDELKKLMGAKAFKKLSNGEIEGMDRVRKRIAIKEELANFPIIDEILDIVYKDCKSMKKTKNRENFRNGYEGFKVDNTVKMQEEKFLKVAFGKMYANTFNYDYDDSLISSYIFCKTIKTPESGEWQIGCYHGYEYKICKGNGFYFRGDTMNSWSTTFNEYMRIFGYKYITGNNEEKTPEHYTITVPDYISDFMKAVYTIGNFALVPGPGAPVDFNRKRNSKFKDYWDLTLLSIYEYYMGETEGWIRSLEKDPESEKAIKNWLNKSKDKAQDQKGWNQFVENNFMNPFVDKKNESGEVCEWGKPKELWNGHFGGKILLPQEEKQFKEFFENATTRIIERGNLIAQALVEAEK